MISLRGKLELAGAIAFLIGGLAIGWWIWCREPAAAAPSETILRDLETIGAVPETKEATPETKDLPRGTRVLEDVSGKGGMRRTAEEQGDLSPVKTPYSKGEKCPDLLAAITPDDLAVSCRSQVIEAAPGFTVARIFGNSSVRLPGGQIVERGCAPGKTCDPEGNEALEDVRYEHTAARAVRRWDGELRIGLELRDLIYDPRPAFRGGGSWYPPGKRFGVAGDISRDLIASEGRRPDYSVSAALAIDIGP